MCVCVRARACVCVCVCVSVYCFAFYFIFPVSILLSSSMEVTRILRAISQLLVSSQMFLLHLPTFFCNQSTYVCTCMFFFPG